MESHRRQSHCARCPRHMTNYIASPLTLLHAKWLIPAVGFHDLFNVSVFAVLFSLSLRCFHGNNLEWWILSCAYQLKLGTSEWCLPPACNSSQDMTAIAVFPHGIQCFAISIFNVSDAVHFLPWIASCIIQRIAAKFMRTRVMQLGTGFSVDQILLFQTDFHLLGSFGLH